MLGKFKKGDRVVIVKDLSGENKYINQNGTVVNISDWDEFGIRVELDFTFNIINCNYLELKLLGSSENVAKQGFMDKLTTLAKRVVDADLRNLIKVGWLDSRLQLTQEGIDVILADYLNENKAKFGKLALEELKELEKDK